MSKTEAGWEVVHSYTREQAIADGNLVDVTDRAKEAGWRIPVALTSAVYEDCVAWSEEDTTRTGMPQDESGRLWDVLWMAALAAKRHTALSKRDPSTPPDQCMVQLYRVPRLSPPFRPQMVALKLMIGPGDAGEPVVTVLEPHED